MDGFISLLIIGIVVAIGCGLAHVLAELGGKAGREQVGRRDVEADRQFFQMARLKAQQGYHEQMIVLGKESIELFESMPQRLDSAEKWLDSAQRNFTDKAFAPFWDSIENAAQWLGGFNDGIQRINANSLRYADLIKKYEGTPPEFPLAPQSISKLGVGTATAQRMQAIVRKAQRDFQFAMIYEQRKTNQILIAGFANLAQALNDMSWHIDDSLAALTASVDGMTSTLTESLRTIHARIGDNVEATTAHLKKRSKEASESAIREMKVLEMLDNIQRRRRPFL